MMHGQKNIKLRVTELPSAYCYRQRWM